MYSSALVSGEYVELVCINLFISEMANVVWISGFLWQYPGRLQTVVRWWFFLWRVGWLLFMVSAVHVPMVRATSARYKCCSGADKLQPQHMQCNRRRPWRRWQYTDYVAFYPTVLLSLGTLGFALSFLEKEHTFASTTASLREILRVDS